MQNKKLFASLVILILLVGAAAFIAGRMFNTRVNPAGEDGSLPESCYIATHWRSKNHKLQQQLD
jgi:hypothetical protein